MTSIDAAFATHVALDDGVLATSAPLEMTQLQRVVVLVEAGLAAYPDTAQRVRELHDRLVTQRVIGAADAVAGMLEILHAHDQARAFFKESIVKVLTGERMTWATPAFSGGLGRVEDPPTVTEEPSLDTTPTKQSDQSPSRESSESPASDHEATEKTREVQRTPTRRTTPSRLSFSSPKTSSPATQPPPVSSPVIQEPEEVVETSSVVSESPSSQRKRSVDSTQSMSSEPVVNRRASVGKRRRTSSAASIAEAAPPNVKPPPSTSPSIPAKDHMDPSLHPTNTVPTPWAEMTYQSVPVININADGAREAIQSLRYNGTPFILEGYSGWMRFAKDWVLKDGSLDTEAFLRGIHDVKVPVIERNYEDTNPIKTHLPLGYYVRNYWEKGTAEYYMHQWQFPLSPKAAKLLCYKCDELPVLGDNLLLYWLDAVRGDNPLQYFFMGQQRTNSRMHQDPGGLDITIAPIVGTKRVTMLHRAAAQLESVHDNVNFHTIDLNKVPLLAFIPAWRVDLHPGQMLYMPEGTFHACENITACLSYHRFHVDSINLPGFLRSFMAQDSPSINHAEILWNAVHDVIASLEEHYYANNQKVDKRDIFILRKLDSLRALRHASCILSLEEAVPTEDSWDWRKLLEDIDHLLVRLEQPQTKRKSKNAEDEETPAKQAAVATAAAFTAAVKTDSVKPKASAKQPAKQPTKPAAKSNGKGKAPASKQLTIAAFAAPASSPASVSSPESTHWDSLDLHVGDVLGVQVHEKRNRAQVLKIAHNMELVQVHYVEWGSIYDEFVPVSSLYHRTTSSRKKRVQYKKAPAVHEPVLAKWGSAGELYNAIVLKVLRSNAVYVHYLKFENDWDQWILPGHIFKKYASTK
ncbi:hypothetical protein Poli38472_013518 [Pythium oligandrum]|uniref:JmjC domain-containing protein n=1 Tax=Pythium oligandrum TaxID=41045 RepID=A0A8K1C7H4_PYTOL|nr:hypothetical protein Poli38472_013518 [Pythium oligandrum]|eukprot:TMW58044.1 hypothetical protein Poli38472_013518 [Pythium oligandrum]